MASATADWFPFTLPWDDTTKSWVDASDLLVDRPGGDPAKLIDARGFVRTDANGHFLFSNTGERARFWGINFGDSANLPPCPGCPPFYDNDFGDVHAAEKLAGRLAKLGFNAIRVHLMDNPWTMLWLRWEDTKQLNPVALQRLDYFIYQLKRHGIYVDLNLHVGREFRPGDGVTSADACASARLSKNRGATQFDPVMIALQKRYAAQLLQHVNPYTGLAYANDPVVLTTETSNEDSLFGPWCDGDQLNYDPADPGSFPEFYSRELDGWTHLSGAGPTINRLLNAGFEAGVSDWYTYTGGNARADFGLDAAAIEGSQALRIEVTQTDGEHWRVQFGQGDLALLQGKAYLLTFAARASQSTTVRGAVTRNGEPWDSLGWEADLALGTQWATHTITFTARETVFGDARVSFDVGQTPLTLWFDAFHLHEVDAFRGWLGWLEDRYGSTAAVAAAWAPANPVPETEILRNGSFEQALTGWEVYAGGSAGADWNADASEATDGAQSLRVEVTSVDGTDWHLQFWQPGLNIRAGWRYRLSFDARSTVPAEVGLNVSQAHDPWDSLGLWTTFVVSNVWEHFEMEFAAVRNEANARVGFDVGQVERTLWFDNVSLRPYNPNGLLPGESLEGNNVARLRCTQTVRFAPQRVRDALRFCYETEAAFYADMQASIQNETGSRSLNTGTAASTLGDSHAMAALDFVDFHWYWDFPNATTPDWPPRGYLVHNRPLVNVLCAGNEYGPGLFGAAVAAVHGKPFTLTEWGESFPNEHAVEGPLLVATIANLQDWDAVFIYGFTDNHRTYALDYVYTDHDLAGNPLKTGEMPVAARIFLDGQTAAAPTESLLSFTEAETYQSAEYGWGGFGADFLQQAKGVDPAAVLGSRLRIGSFTAPAPVTPRLPIPSGPVYRSAGGQLTWDVSDPERGLFTFNAPEAQGAVGFLAGRTVSLANLTLTVPAGTAPFAAVTLQSQDNRPIASSAKLLLGVFTRVANTGAVWNDDRTSLAVWGTAPTLIEPIEFTATLTLNDTRGVQVRILNQTGALQGRVPHQMTAPGKIRIAVDTSRDHTLWYAVGPLWSAHLPLILR